MSGAGMSGGALSGDMSSEESPAPFALRSALAVVVASALLLLGIGWMTGAGLVGTNLDNGGSHAGAHGLNGFAGFARLLDKAGYEVALGRSPASLAQHGLLVLTPPQNADGKEIDRIVSRHRLHGPVLVILPKWLVSPVASSRPGAHRGWVDLDGTMPPDWKGFLDDVAVSTGRLPKGYSAAQWTSAGITAHLPAPERVQWGETFDANRIAGAHTILAPLIVTQAGERILAARVEEETDAPRTSTPTMREPYPLILVFEPDLLDNYGLARPENAEVAEMLAAVALDGGGVGSSGRRVTFDLTLNGLARPQNLLTLAFTPPYLAATLCLLLAGIAAGWRAFLRFGPPRAEERAIAFGKRALVDNGAALIRRARRMHLVPAPYADAARARLAHALGLPRHADPDATEAAIDRQLMARDTDLPRFSQAAAALRAARHPSDMLRAARALHAIERTLTQ